MQVYSNVPAFGVWTHYTNQMSKMRESMNRLSSGSRINAAKDDPSGLAMSERLRAQVRGSAMAAQSIQNHQAYMRTADSWMQKIHDMLHRMNELAISANDGTKSDSDRANLQVEFHQLQQEITRITTGSLARGRFNNQYIFDGGRNGLVTQVGADPGQLFCASPLSLHADSTAHLGRIPHTYRCGTYADYSANEAEQAVRWSMVLARGGGGIPQGIHISSQQAAMRATAVLKLAIDHLGRARATMGAEAGRLSHSLEGLRTYHENVMSAESLIRDTDMAKESTILLKHQVLAQVGTAMLAQANAIPQNVAQLVGA